MDTTMDTTTNTANTTMDEGGLFEKKTCFDTGFSCVFNRDYLIGFIRYY